MSAIEPRLAKPSRKLLNKLLIGLMVIAGGVFAWRIYSGQTIEAEQKNLSETSAQKKLLEASVVNPAEVARRFAEQEETGRKAREQEARAAARTDMGTTALAQNGPVQPPLTNGPQPQSRSSQEVPELEEEAKAQRDSVKSARGSRFQFYEPGGNEKGHQIAQPTGAFLTPDQIAVQAQRIQAQSSSAQSQAGAGPNQALVELVKAQQQARSPYAAGQGTLTQVNNEFIAQNNTPQQLIDPVPLQPKKKTSDFILHEETIIKVAMTRKLNSDLPGGSCQGRVIEDVYDSIHMRYVLIPQHTKINCVYNSEVIPGQNRLLFAFTRMVFPNGATLRLGAMPGSDSTGAAGAEAEVDNHFWRIFGSSFVIGSVALAASNNNAPSNVTINVGGGYSGGGVSQLGAQVLSDTTKRILDRYQNIKPTLKLNIGDTVSFVVKRDLILDPAITGGWKAF